MKGSMRGCEGEPVRIASQTCLDEVSWCSVLSNVGRGGLVFLCEFTLFLDETKMHAHAYWQSQDVDVVIEHREQNLILVYRQSN